MTEGRRRHHELRVFFLLPAICGSVTPGLCVALLHHCSLPMVTLAQ